MGLNIPKDAQFPGFELVYSLLPSGSSIDLKSSITPKDVVIEPGATQGFTVSQDFGWTITYPTGVQEDLIDYVTATPGLGLRIIRANNK